MVAELIVPNLCFALLSGAFYRMGGSDIWNPKWRDWGCSLTFLGALVLNYTSKFRGYSPSLLAGVGFALFLLLWGSLSTYWKGDKPDVKWYHWGLHGLGVGLSALPLLWCNFCLVGILIRSIAISILYILWSESNDNVVYEETGRGVIIILTIPFLCL